MFSLSELCSTCISVVLGLIDTSFEWHNCLLKSTSIFKENIQEDYVWIMNDISVKIIKRHNSIDTALTEYNYWITKIISIKRHDSVKKRHNLCWIQLRDYKTYTYSEHYTSTIIFKFSNIYHLSYGHSLREIASFLAYIFFFLLCLRLFKP